MQLQIKQINTQGQISIGKKYAGNKVQVEEYPLPIQIFKTQKNCWQLHG